MLLRLARFFSSMLSQFLKKLVALQDAPAPDPGDTDGIVSIIRSMPEQYRQVLELKFLLEWSDEMIAQKLGLTLNATYTRISRGKKLLRERLIQEGYADETN